MIQVRDVVTVVDVRVELIVYEADGGIVTRGFFPDVAPLDLESGVGVP